jgi:multicomponent Na+:H+ antiporter subunit C
MSVYTFYALTGTGLFGIGLYYLLADTHLLRKILAVNVIGAAISLIIVALAGRTPIHSPDPVPLALVITGIVVLVSTTAFALALYCRFNEETGRSDLTEEDTL